MSSVHLETPGQRPFKAELYKRLNLHLGITTVKEGILRRHCFHFFAILVVKNIYDKGGQIALAFPMFIYFLFFGLGFKK